MFGETINNLQSYYLANKEQKIKDNNSNNNNKTSISSNNINVHCGSSSNRNDMINEKSFDNKIAEYNYYSNNNNKESNTNNSNIIQIQNNNNNNNKQLSILTPNSNIQHQHLHETNEHIHFPNANNSISSSKPKPLDYLEPFQNEYPFIQYKHPSLCSPSIALLNKRTSTSKANNILHNIHSNSKPPTMHKYISQYGGDTLTPQTNSACLSDTFNLDTTFFINALTAENIDPHQSMQMHIHKPHLQPLHNQLYNEHYNYTTNPKQNNEMILNHKRVRNNSPLKQFNISTLNVIQSPRNNDLFIPPKNPNNISHKPSTTFISGNTTTNNNTNTNTNNQLFINSSKYNNDTQRETTSPEIKGNDYFDQVDLAFEEFDEYNNNNTHSPIIDPNKKHFISINSDMNMSEMNMNMNMNKQSNLSKEIKPYKSKIIISEKAGRTSVTAIASNELSTTNNNSNNNNNNITALAKTNSNEMIHTETSNDQYNLTVVIEIDSKAELEGIENQKRQMRKQQNNKQQQIIMHNKTIDTNNNNNDIIDDTFDDGSCVNNNNNKNNNKKYYNQLANRKDSDESYHLSSNAKCNSNNDNEFDYGYGQFHKRKNKRNKSEGKRKRGQKKKEELNSNKSDNENDS